MNTTRTHNMPDGTRKLAEQSGLTQRQLESMENARPPQGDQSAMPAGFVKMAERFGYNPQQIEQLTKVREIAQPAPPATPGTATRNVREADPEADTRTWTAQDQQDLAMLRREICGW